MTLAQQLRDPSGTAYVDAGSGPPIVLLHGVGLTGAMWSPIAERLQQRHRVIVPDMLGHGGSPQPRADASLADYAKQIVTLVRHLGIASAGVVGFSMGAM